MEPVLNILCTLRNPKLWQATVYVFRSVRIGFPKAKIRVWGNGIDAGWFDFIKRNTIHGAEFRNFQYVSHDRWIENLILTQQTPFWICDTDVLFKAKVEDWFENDNKTVFAGQLQETFKEPWTKSIYQERLHTAVMYINPSLLKAEMMRCMKCTVPEPWLTAEVPFVRQTFIPSRSGLVFYDTMCGVWQAGLGTPFEEWQNKSFEHLHGGTYSDKLSQQPEYKDLQMVHDRVFKGQMTAEEVTAIQKQFFINHKV